MCVTPKFFAITTSRSAALSATRLQKPKPRPRQHTLERSGSKESTPFAPRQSDSRTASGISTEDRPLSPDSCRRPTEIKCQRSHRRPGQYTLGRVPERQSWRRPFWRIRQTFLGRLRGATRPQTSRDIPETGTPTPVTNNRVYFGMFAEIYPLVTLHPLVNNRVVQKYLHFLCLTG